MKELEGHLVTDHPVISEQEDLARYRMQKHEPKSLPFMTRSICPDCYYIDSKINVIDAEVYDDHGKVMMQKTCTIHGMFHDVYWSDTEMFNRIMRYWYKTIGLDNPRTKCIDGCPNDCGPCPNHLAHTALGLIDVTNRCNMACPICFANAKVSGEIYEPSPEQVLGMLENLRKNLPAPCPAVQFAGGEPTLSDHLPQYIKWAINLGFRHVMVATNGIRIAKQPGYLTTLKNAGLKTLYLQFDGVSEKPYIIARNRDLRDVKNAVLNQCRAVDLDGVILVPTIVRGVNSNELGGIIDYGLDNRDIVRCINFQPVSVTGRIEKENREGMRITTPDLIHLIESQTDGQIKADAWYPISSMMGIGRALGLIRNRSMFELHAHPACGMATFLFIDPNGSYYPITEIVNLEGVLGVLEEICDIYAKNKRLSGLRSRIKLLRALKYVEKKSFMRPIISSFLNNGSYSSLKAFMSKVIMLGIMHFQDPFNIDLERVQHCGINYATPDGRIISFCTYNNFHRDIVEQELGGR